MRKARAVVVVTAVTTTAFGLVTPIATAAAQRGHTPVARGLARSGIPARANVKARIDPALLGKRGAVDVMLQLSPAAAVVPYAAAAHTPASHRVSVFRAQQGRIRSAQSAVTDRLHQPATRAQHLFSVQNLYDGVAVRTDASRLSALSNLPGVVAVHELVPKHLLNSVTVPLIGAPQAWQGASGDTGTGIKIGIIDTGIDYTHADFGGPGTKLAYDTAKANDTTTPTYPDPAKVAGGFDFAGEAYDPDAGTGFDSDNNANDAIPQPDPNPLDCSGHGTHVAGTAAGLGVNADGSTFTGDYSSLASLTPAQYQATFKIGPGVAPGATLYALKIFGCGEETGTSSDLISQALDWAAAIQSNGKPRLDVVNMSLGADFTTADDPDAVAANNASLAGVTVVAAAGNAGDEFDAAGAPGNAVRAISVAASDDTTDLVDGVTFSDVTGNQPAEESSAFPWATSPVTAGAGLTKSLAVIGDGKLADWRSPSATTGNNSDGCDPLSASDAASVKGNIALLSWTDNDSARRCGSAARTTNVFNAGAVGVVLADDENEFAAGILGTSDIPTVITSATAGNAVAQDVFANKNVTATLTFALHNKVTDVHPETQDAIATFTSRGGGEAGLLKPDISAPGVTVFSALFGSGNDGTSNNGTSMATPHVTGSAALVRAAHPSWTPEQVKAALMNTADQDVFARAADGSANHNAPEAPERVGAGRVEVNQAVADSVLAYATGHTGAVSVSFGPVSTATPVTLSRAITVQNTSSSPVTYTVGYDAANTNPGASYSVATTSCSSAGSSATVSVPANGTAQVLVCLSITPSSLTSHPDPTLTLQPQLAAPYDVFQGAERSFISTVSGRVTLTSQGGGTTLRVPVYAAPRPASKMSQPATVRVPTTGGSLQLSGTGVEGASPAGSDALSYSIADAFELQGASGALPICKGTATPPGCVPTSQDRAGDLRYVGYATDAPLYPADDAHLDPWSPNPEPNGEEGPVAPARAYIGIATNWPWTTPDYGVYLVWFDLDGDGNPDAVLYNTRIPGTDVFVAELASVDENGIPQFVYDDELLNGVDGEIDTGLFDSDVMTMPFALAALKWIGIDESRAKQGLAPIDASQLDSFPDPTGRISYFVDSGTIDSGQLLDSVGDPLDGGKPMTINPVAPGLSATESVTCPQGAPDMPSCAVPTFLDDQPGFPPLSVQRTGELLADRPLGLLLLHHDNLPGQRAQVVRFDSSVTAALAHATAPYGYHDPLTVHVSSTVGVPGGTVTVTEGRTKLAAGAVHGGAVTLTLPVRSVGRHTLTVTFSGDAAHGPATRTVTLTVTKASTHTSLSLSGSRTVTLTALTSVVSPGHASITGTVRFYDNGHLFATRSTGGKVAVRRTLSGGRHTLTAKYSGNSVLNASSASRSHSV